MGYTLCVQHLSKRPDEAGDHDRVWHWYAALIDEHGRCENVAIRAGKLIALHVTTEPSVELAKGRARVDGAKNNNVPVTRLSFPRVGERRRRVISGPESGGGAPRNLAAASLLGELLPISDHARCQRLKGEPG